MIIYYQGEEEFCQRVGYSHSTNVLTNTLEVRSNQELKTRVYHHLQTELQDQEIHEST